MRGRTVECSINEERLDRYKLSTGFPALAIGRVLEETGTRPEDLSGVYVADEHNYYKPVSTKWRGWLGDYPSFRKKLMYGAASRVSGIVGNSHLVQQLYYALRRRLTAGRQDQVRARLRNDFGISAPVSFLDHHYCHALTAYYTAGFPDATIITLDGGGDGMCSRVYRVRQGRFELIHSLNSYHSIGNYYAYVTHLCGFTAHKHEGKITGLAACGEPVYRDLLSRMIRYEDGDIRNRGNAYYWSAVRKLERALPSDWRIEDLAASIQAVLEDVVTRYCAYWIDQSGLPHVALAGGVFANVRLNQRIHEIEHVEGIFVHPGMGDEGLSFGAALEPLAEGALGDPTCEPEPISDVYLGPGFSDAEIETAIRAAGLSPERSLDLPGSVAEHLAQGSVIARFDGRMEYGPRALGNRSILYQPTDPSVNDWLNEKLVRTEFMPFAPVVRTENANVCFDNVEGALDAARFMTITFECTPSMKRLCPGVVHVDGSARPQLVTESINGDYYRILEAYEERTGLPAIINTSFNVHDEPIVCTPEDAVKGFLAAELDYLAIGNFLVEHPRGARRRGRDGVTIERMEV